VLDYFNLDDLISRISFEKTNDGILLRFKLTLQGIKDKGTEFTIKREYHLSEKELQPIEQIPVVEIWPNFKAIDWSAYYTYYSHQKGARTLDALPLSPGAIVISQSSKLVKCKTPKIGERFERINQITKFPEAFNCTFDLPNTSLKKFETTNAGLIFLKQPEPRQQPKDWKIGIDFGTTGTNVFYTEGESSPRRFLFEDLFIHVTSSSDEDLEDTIFYRFVAGKNAIAPFLTIYHDFQIANPDEALLRPVLDGHIFFKNINTELDIKDESIHTNLKWGTSREDRKRAVSFLTQLALQCAAQAAKHGAKSISWRYSFPTAFSPGEIQYYHQAWNKIISITNNLTGLFPEKAEDAKQAATALFSKTESIASGQFFADNRDITTEVPFGEKGICIDIGGGTSDISIWHENKLRWQASIRFAGRDTLMKIFFQNPIFLELLEKERKKEVTLLQELADSNEINKFNAQLDVLLKERGATWLSNLWSIGGEVSLKGFLQLVALALSGIAFYVGQVLKALAKNSNFPDEIPNLFIGGNGARMFDWLVGGEKFTARSPIGSLFKTMLINGSEFKIDDHTFQICTSPEPKSEVAYGLVSDVRKLVGTEQQYIPEMIAGEVFIENGEQKNWYSSLTVEKLHKGIGKPDHLEQFQKFLDTFNGFVKLPANKDIIKPIREDKPLLFNCIQHLAGYLTDNQGRELDDIHVEPLFIIVLKHFLDNKINQWAQTQQPI